MIYVASPWSTKGGHSRDELRRYAARCCEYVRDAGHKPVCPHMLLDRRLDDDDPLERAIGCAAGRGMMGVCSEAWFFVDHGRSPGMISERALGIELARHVREVVLVTNAEAAAPRAETPNALAVLSYFEGRGVMETATLLLYREEEVRALRAAGWIEHVGYVDWVLTEAGRARLAAEREGSKP